MIGSGILPYCRARLLRGLAAPLLLSVAGVALGEEFSPPTSIPVHPLPQPAPLDLAACQQIALEKQPAIQAAHASLAAAIARSQAVEHLHVPAFLARDLPVRRQQAATGIIVAEAALHQAENNTRYAVSFCYLAALYAQEQEELAEDAVDRLNALRETVDDYIKKEAREIYVSARDRDKIDAYLAIVRGNREEARLGRERALSALREAMGVPGDCPLLLSRRTLFVINPSVDCKAIVALAVERRPELIQAIQGGEAAGLEVCAQMARRHPTAPTFASGSDLHSQPLPAGSYDENYKPGAVGPEMPVTLAGSRKDRVEQAKIYAGRAEVVVEKVRNLIVLEAEQAVLRWAEAARKLPELEAAYQAAEAARKKTQQVFAPEGTPREPIDRLFEAGALAMRLRSEINQNRYRLLLALAALERVSACGFHADFGNAPPDLPRVRFKKEELEGKDKEGNAAQGGKAP
jgi:outer membrane protein TolC